MADSKKMGRPPANGEKMSKAEYQRRYRAKKKAEKQQDAYLVMPQDDLQAFSKLAEVFGSTRMQLMGVILAGAKTQLEGLAEVLQNMPEERAEQVKLYKYQALRLISEGGNLVDFQKKMIADLSGMSVQNIEDLIAAGRE
jgi:ribosomal protein L7/L12